MSSEAGTLRKARRTCSSSRLGCVAIVGGTHGNETNGVFLAKHFMQASEAVKRPSFETIVTLSNVASIKANARYVETDMNRCFLLQDLKDDSGKLNTLEQKRAKEINSMLGPKQSQNPKADFIFDLHNTTAATGVALMMAPDDDFAHEVGAYLQSIDASVTVVNWGDADDWSMLPSIGRSGMTFEVGAAPWGAVEPSQYRQSHKLLLAALDYIEAHNSKFAEVGDKRKTRTKDVTVEVVKRLLTLDYPKDESGGLAAFIHPDLQGRDFSEIKDGDPMFMNLDCSDRYFSKKAHGVDKDTKVYPFFINEAAYYEKGIAMMLGTRTAITYTILDLS